MKVNKLVRKPSIFQIVIIAISLVVVGYALYAALSAAPATFPPSLLSAWREAGIVSADIVRLMGDTSHTIEEVNALDLQGDTGQAMGLVGKARESNRLAYAKAVELTQKLQQFTESLREVPSASDQRTGYQAAAAELSLVSEFIVYTESLNRFLDRVASAVTTNAPADRQAVEDTLREVNERAKKINELNETFLGTIKAAEQSL